MTGFGRASIKLGGLNYSLEIRSVNHRYLDLRMNLPRELLSWEVELRALISQAIKRGRVELNVQAPAESVQPQRLEINWELARSLRAAHAQLAEALDIPDTLDTARLAQWPGLFISQELEPNPERGLKPLLEGLKQALEALGDMRLREGKALESELLLRLKELEHLRLLSLAQMPSQAVAYRHRLESRLLEMLKNLDLKIDEGKILHEVAVFAEKSDIAEELSRLESHFEQAQGLIQAEAGVAVGRGLDFLCQEMLRESNTIASKAQSLALSELAIALKAELERLREQVQNVE